MKKLLQLLLVVLLATVPIIFLVTSPLPYSRQEISGWTVKLNEAAAVGIPHGSLIDEKTKTAHSVLLNKVEAGSELSAQETAQYRKIFQTALQENQPFLGAFDGELSILEDHEPRTKNNVFNNGISGAHDHHDLSARRNFSQLLTELGALKTSPEIWNSFRRISAINSAYKNLVDLISHLGVASHTISVPYKDPIQAWSDGQLGIGFEAMLRAYKRAQFVPINSVAYWKEIDAALGHYDDLIFDVQTRIVATSSAWERRIAGRFMSLQTLAPPIDKTPNLRR